jgi:subtilase family serine protease
MQRSLLVPLSVCAVVVFLFWAVNPVSSGQTGPQDRILQQIDRSQMTALRGSLLPQAKAQYDRGRVSPDMALHGVSINFQLSASQQADLQQLLAAQQDPSSPEYHKWLTPEQYAARFGMSQGDLDRVTSWLQSEGFTGIRISRGHTQVSFSGTAAQVAAAFRTEIHQFNVNGKMHFANATALSVPSALSGTVLSVGHLNDFRPLPRAHRLPQAHFTSSQTGNHFVGPGDFATIYDIKPLYAAGIDGSGITIAVVGQTEIDPSDDNTFRSLSGLPANPPQVLLVPNSGSSAVFTGDLDEANLDVEWSGAVAKNATVLYVYVGDNLNFNVFDSLFDVIDNDLAPVIGISYGNCEANIKLPGAQTLQSWAQQANAQGQTISAASGDSGAGDCDTGATATHGLAVDIPAAIPEVTGIGGTEFTGDNTAGADPPYWAGATGSTDPVDTALQYIPEMGWNDSPVTGTGPLLGTTLSATGGGKSTFFTTKPTWQTALTPADGVRDVPDISMPGSPNHDGYLVCSQGSCVNGFRFSDGSLTVFGGTSVGAQVFAGVLGILNQATQSSGLGNANINLYQLAGSTPAAFHDITTGNNIVPCTQGSTNCPTTAPFQIGFSAGTGYDLVTGLGSLDVNNLVTAWPGFAATPSFTVSGTDVPNLVAGDSGSSTITVSSTTGFNGTVDLSCAFVPPPPTSAGLTCSFGSTTSVTLDGTNTPQTAVMMISTTAPHALSSTTADAQPHGSMGWFLASGGTLLAGVFVIGAPGRRWRWLAVLGLCSAVFLAVGIGCGGSSKPPTPTAAMPTFSPAPGNYTQSATVTLSDATPGATVLCTTDGTTPTINSTICSSPITLTSTTTIKAIAVASGFNNSPVASGTYTIQAGTASGAYVVTVTAKSGSVSQSTHVNVTVQ